MRDMMVAGFLSYLKSSNRSWICCFVSVSIEGTVVAVLVVVWQFRQFRAMAWAEVSARVGGVMSKQVSSRGRGVSVDALPSLWFGVL